MRRLAIFDWNGTLFDDLDANVRGAGAIFEALGRRPLSAEEYQNSFTFPILHFYTANGIGADEYLSNHDRLSQEFLRVYEAAAMECDLRCGAVELLQWLTDNDVDCMLLSNHLRENVGQQLARFHIRHFFRFISCNTEFDASFIRSMNKYERLKEFLDTNRYDPENAFIAGDTFEEADIARRLGITGFSLTGGCISRERLEAKGGDHVTGGFVEMSRHIGRMWDIDYGEAS